MVKFMCLNCKYLDQSAWRHGIFNVFHQLVAVGSDVFVAPALARRHRRASFRPFVRSFVRPSIHPSTFNMGIL